MHNNQKLWFADLQKAHPWAFVRPTRVLELGSRDINGNPRSFFDVDTYVGVDVTKGNCVDIMCAAKDYKCAQPFDVVVCMSMLEHDPNWKESLAASFEFLRGGGILILTYGAEGNTPHCEDDMPFVELGWSKVRDEACRVGYRVLDIIEEERRYGGDIPGCYNLLASKP